MKYSKFSVFLLFLLSFLSFPVPGIRADDDRFRGWRQTETEHFRFIFEPRDAQAAKELATFCEDVYQKVGGYFHYYPKHIDCVIHGRIDTANGSFEPLPNKLHLNVTSPSGPWIGVTTENWLKILLTHELTHYIHLTYNKGFFYILSLVLGKAVRPADAGFLPDWMIEGLSTELETQFTSGGRGRNPFFELYWKAPVLEDGLFSLPKASYPSVYPPPGRPYVAGYMIVSYMMARYGNSVFKDINREFVKFPFLGPAAAIRKVTGSSIRQIYDDMTASLKERYSGDRQIQSGKLISPDSVGNYYLPVITEKGWVLYRSSLNKRAGLILYHPETGKEEILQEAALTDSASYTADSRCSRVIFSSFTEDNLHPSGSTLTSDLYQFDVSSGKTVKLTKNAHVWQPALSPDGSMLAAVQGTGSYSRLVEIVQKTGKTKELFSIPETTVFNPSFSPDGSHIVFALNARGVQDIWVYTVKTGTAEPLCGIGPAGDYYPRFVNNSDVFFSSDRDGDLSLYKASLKRSGISLIQRDSIGAYTGTSFRGELIYGSYSSKGWCLKSAPLEEHQGEPVRKEPRTALPPEFEWKEITTKPYFDFPKPVLWVPFPFYINPLYYSETTWGATVYAMGTSLAGSSSWSILTGARFDPFQLSADIAITAGIGPLNLGYSLLQSYYRSSTGSYVQGTRQKLDITLPILSRGTFRNDMYAAVSAGISHTYTMSGLSPFPFFNGFSFSGMNQRNILWAEGSGRFSVVDYGSAADIFQRLKFSTQADIDIPLPVFPGTPAGAVANGFAEFSFPSFFRHQFIRLGAKVNYTPLDLLSYRSITPRGLFNPEAQPYEGSTLFSFDYLFSLGIFDQPFPIGSNLFGISFKGLAGGVHAELLADWSPSGDIFTMDRYIYTGAEIILLVGYSTVTVPVGIGITARFDRTLQESFSIAGDLRPYVFVGLDSFFSTLISTGSGSVPWTLRLQ